MNVFDTISLCFLLSLSYGRGSLHWRVSWDISDRYLASLSIGLISPFCSDMLKTEGAKSIAINVL